jgi:XTP/dITP diphosphohydrolase
VKIVLASKNSGKLRELRNTLTSDIEWVPADEFYPGSPQETGFTFVENAILKARYACKMTGLSAIADDSGLEVDYLKGAPGIRSSRYAGDSATDKDNNSKLLGDLKGVEQHLRTCRFRCVIVILRYEFDPMPIIAEGTWEGEILTSAQGDNGFGYDPLFLVPDLGVSAAQLAAVQKNKISHRGRAMARLSQLLVTL